MVKSGKNYTLTSLKKFRNKYAEQTDTPPMFCIPEI